MSIDPAAAANGTIVKQPGSTTLPLRWSRSLCYNRAVARQAVFVAH